MKNFYDILGISKTASDKDIKKAYKKAVLLHHPDRGGNEEKFKEIAHAYEVLTDKEKKQIYDKYGEEGLKQGGGAGMDPFNMFPFNMDPFFRQRQDQQVKKCDATVVQVEVTLEQLYNGDKIIKTVPLNKICSSCKGSGAKDKYIPQKCEECHGKGIKIIRRQIAPGMIQQMQAVCEKCGGQGKVIDNKHKCQKCNGNKVVKNNKKFDIHVTSTLYNGKEILYRDKGEEHPGFNRGDILFIIVEEEHKLFKRNNKYNLYIKKTINLVEALTGTYIIVEHLDKRKIYVETHEVIKPNTYKKIIGEGIPQGKGDLIIEFEIIFPLYVDMNYRKQLEEICGQNVDNVDVSKMKEGLLLDHYLNTDKNEEEDDMREGVQCQQQ